MLPRLSSKQTTVLGSLDLDHKIHPGRQTTDWDLLSVLITRPTAEAITLKVQLRDAETGEVYVIGEYTSWEGQHSVFTEYVRCDRNLQVEVVSSGSTSPGLTSRIVYKLATQE